PDRLISEVASTSKNIEYSKINDKNQNKVIYGKFNPIELIKSQLPLRGRKIIYIAIFVILIFGSLIKYYKMGAGFCDSKLRENTENSLFEDNCIPCPPCTHCSKGKVNSCDEGFELVSSSIHWLKPFTSRCILDLNRERRAKEYTRLLKSIVFEEIGKNECECDHREFLLFQNLLILLRNKKLPLQDTDQNFKTFAQLALENLRSDDHVKVIDEWIGYKTNTYIVPKNPRRSLVCQIKTSLFKINSFVDWIKEHLSIITHAKYLGKICMQRPVLIIIIDMPTKLVEAHEKYKKQNYGMLTHIMFHGTKSLCDSQRFITNPRAGFCKSGCGVCGIMQEGNKIKYASNRRNMWFANSSSTSYNYCNTSLMYRCYSDKYYSTTNAMFVVDVVARYYESVLIVERDEAVIPKYLIIFQ
ncbi:9469_t:CDS:2, partial [Dentiscutata heterogama]